MNSLDRLIILLASILVVLLGLALSVAALGWDPTGSAANIAAFIKNHRIEAGLTGLILLLAGWHLIFYSVSPTREDGIIRESTLGQIRIQYRALENLVVRTAQEVEGIRDVEARIVSENDEVAITVSLTLLPEHKISDVSGQVQHNVEAAVREVAGVPVASVAVEVRSLAGQAKAQKATRPRVE